MWPVGYSNMVHMTIILFCSLYCEFKQSTYNVDTLSHFLLGSISAVPIIFEGNEDFDLTIDLSNMVMLQVVIPTVIISDDERKWYQKLVIDCCLVGLDCFILSRWFIGSYFNFEDFLMQIGLH